MNKVLLNNFSGSSISFVFCILISFPLESEFIAKFEHISTKLSLILILIFSSLFSGFLYDFFLFFFFFFFDLDIDFLLFAFFEEFSIERSNPLLFRLESFNIFDCSEFFTYFCFLNSFSILKKLIISFKVIEAI